MKNISTTMILTLSVLLFSGCAAKTGHTFLEKMSQEEISTKLIHGKTTKVEVIKMFGDPEDVDLRDDGREVWVYKFIRSSAKGVNFVPIANSFYAGTNDNIKRLKISFDTNSVVDKFAFSNAKGETKAGLFQ